MYFVFQIDEDYFLVDLDTLKTEKKSLAEIQTLVDVDYDSFYDYNVIYNEYMNHFHLNENFNFTTFDVEVNVKGLLYYCSDEMYIKNHNMRLKFGEGYLSFGTNDEEDEDYKYYTVINMKGILVEEVLVQVICKVNDFIILKLCLMTDYDVPRYITLVYDLNEMQFVYLETEEEKIKEQNDLEESPVFLLNSLTNNNNLDDIVSGKMILKDF